MPNNPAPVVMPQGPGGLQWNLGIPDLGGSAYTNMANSLTKSLNEGTANLSQNIKAAAGTGQLLQVMGNMKGPDGKTPMLDPEMMNDISTKGLAAQQKFLGMAMPSIMQQQQAQNENTSQQRMLQMYQANPDLFAIKMGMQSPGSRPPSTYYQQPQQQPQQAPVQQTPQPVTPQSPQQNPPAAQTKNAPKFTAPPGYQWSQQQHPNNPDLTLHVLHAPDGSVAQIYNPDGSLFR
jgi:hypothetical protein